MAGDTSVNLISHLLNSLHTGQLIFLRFKRIFDYTFLV